MASTRLPDLFLCLLPRPTYSLMPGPWTSLPKLQERVCVCVFVCVCELNVQGCSNTNTDPRDRMDSEGLQLTYTLS